MFVPPLRLGFSFTAGLLMLATTAEAQRAPVDAHRVATMAGRSPVYAPGLYDVLVYFDELFRRRDPTAHKPIFIMENGLVDQKRARKLQGESDRAAYDRGRYLSDHVREVQRAHARGVNVIGYLVWSLTSNREWGLRYGPDNDFGLYGIALDDDPALDDPTRPISLYESDAVDTYRAIIKQRGVGS